MHNSAKPDTWSAHGVIQDGIAHEVFALTGDARQVLKGKLPAKGKLKKGRVLCPMVDKPVDTVIKLTF